MIIKSVITSEAVPYRGGLTRSLIQSADCIVAPADFGVTYHDVKSDRVVYVPYTNIPYIVTEVPSAETNTTKDNSASPKSQKSR
jgi:hypothetical protein